MVVHYYKCVDIFVFVSLIPLLPLRYFLFLIQDINKLMRRL